MKTKLNRLKNIFLIIVGSAIFGIGLDLFMIPYDMNAGGLSGLSMILVHLLGFGTVGTVTMIVNIPLFALGGWRIGKEFFAKSLLGMIASSVFIDVFSFLPTPAIDPLLSSLYGGVTCGLGLGTVFLTGATTGGSDIIVRFMKRKWPHMPIGTINTCFDLVVVTLTGITFGDMSKALYSGLTVFVMGKVIDAVVYHFDYSRVALIITKKHEQVAKVICEDLDRGATFLHGEGAYGRQSTEVVLTVVKRQQIADLKRMVVDIDPDAFVIVQEAHQVLGEGFSSYSKDAL
ncbi:MAG: YitT family protein [Ruminococcaceae bacterium]|nr:YitT family protein [Oscillospiraceae bacterium]